MQLVIAPYLAAVVLLGVAGAAKTAKPTDTIGALRSVGIRAGRRTVRLGSASEVAVAVLALTTGGPTAPALVAISYIALAGFVFVAWKKGGAVSSCGCFGERDTPPTVLHAVLNAAAAVTALAITIATATATATKPPLHSLPAGHLHSAMVLLLSATIAYVAYLAMAILPQTRPSR